MANSTVTTNLKEFDMSSGIFRALLKIIMNMSGFYMCISIKSKRNLSH